MAVTVNLTVKKTFDLSRFVECFYHLMRSLSILHDPDVTVYGWECSQQFNDGNMCLESKWAVDDDAGNTTWDVLQMMVPGVTGASIPLVFVAQSGALCLGAVSEYGSGWYGAEDWAELSEGFETLAGLYLNGLVEDLCAAEVDIAGAITSDTGVWGDKQSLVQGLCSWAGGMFPAYVGLQAFDNEQVAWAGTGDYQPTLGASKPVRDGAIETAPIVSALNEMSMARMDISVNNGGPSWSFRGGSRVT